MFTERFNKTDWPQNAEVVAKIRCLEVRWGTSPGPEYRRGSQKFNKTGAGPARQGPDKPLSRP